jgi:hypothetical protein
MLGNMHEDYFFFRRWTPGRSDQTGCWYLGLGTPRDALGLLGLTDQGSDSENIKVAKKKQKKRRSKEVGEDGQERPREHPFIVTEPGEPAKGKKNGLDYLFDLYEQCGKFLEEVQQIAKEKGEKCPTKVEMLCESQIILQYLDSSIYSCWDLTKSVGCCGSYYYL